MNRLKVVLDTNVFLVSIAPKGRYNWVFQLVLQNKIELILSNDILFEYREICGTKYPKAILDDLFEAIMEFSNVKTITPHFTWNLIYQDADDNKFVDCAIAGNADYIITNDAHFNVLKKLFFPKVSVLNLSQFQTLFKSSLPA